MSTYDGPSTVYINEESYNEADEYYDVSPERRRRRKSHDVTDSPASSHQSGSSLKSRDRPQGWSLHSLYTRLMKTFHRAWKEVRFSGEYVSFIIFLLQVENLALVARAIALGIRTRSGEFLLFCLIIQGYRACDNGQWY